MYGRYGTDQLSKAVLISSLVVYFVNLFWWHNFYVATIIWIILLWNVFRCYSRNIVKRRQENELYLRFVSAIKRRIMLFQKQSQDRSHKYFMCPNCQKFVRVPKGHGKITITCPNCRTKFDKKS